MIQNGYDVATQANSTREGASTWPTCVACAILSRSLERNGETVPEACQQCFTDYCWNGTLATSSAPYFPQLLNAQASSKDSGVGKLSHSTAGFALIAAVAGYLMI
jgi:lysophospholipase